MVLFKLEGGYLTGTSKAFNGTRISTYNTTKSSNLYYRTTISFFLSKGITVGLTYVFAPKTVFDYSFYNVSNPVDASRLHTTETIYTFVVSFGVYLYPKFRKK